MQLLCVALVTLGAGVMLYSIAEYLKSLNDLKSQTGESGLFSNWIYAVCLVMMIFFLAGYVINLILFTVRGTEKIQDLLIALIFFFGAVFVLAMVTMMRRMFAAIIGKAELEKRLEREELISAVSRSFTVTGDPEKLILNALKICGRFLNVNHAFLSRYEKERGVLECQYEWYDEKGRPFIGDENKWPLSEETPLYADLISGSCAAITDCKLLDGSDSNICNKYRMGAFLIIPIDISGRFWGVLEFVLYETPREWNESDIRLCQLIAGVFSGVIAKNIAERELVSAKEAAEQANRSKGDFLSQISHEMRTPMNAIIGMTSIGKSAEDIKRKDYCFGRIEEASIHLLGVINNVLDMSKIEANKLELSYADFSLAEMLARVVNVLTYQMEEKNQRFTLSVDDDIPPFIKSDEQKLGQVVSNLLGNAAKFTPNGGEISLSVKKTREENGMCTLRFEVKDSGIGISPEQQAKLFRPFEQADGSITRKYGGTGLGLVIAKQIVEMMGGTIKIESAIGKGAIFSFDIRAAIASASAERADSAGASADRADETARGATAHDFTGRKIMIAEDIEINREVVEALLEPTGITIVFAENGRAAADTYIADPDDFDAVFMDIHMPGMDGYKATQIIRAFEKDSSRRHIPIIAMTADVFRGDIEKCLAAGMDDHIGKPLDIDDLLKKIGKYCVSR